MLDTDANVGSILVDPGGDLDVAASVSGFTLQWTGLNTDLSNARIDLMGDLTLQSTFGEDYSIGSVNGGFNLTLNGSGQVTLNGAIGNTSRLNNLTTDAGGSTVISGDIRTTGTHTFNDPVTLTTNITLAGSSPSFAQGLDADGNSVSLVYTSALILPDQLAPLSNVNNLTVGESQSRGNSVNAQLNGTVTTSGSQNYLTAMFLLSNSVLESTGNGSITLRQVDGAQALTINTGGLTDFRGNLGFDQRLTWLETDVQGSNRLTNTSDIFLFDGTDP
ncbi:MAG: hypothetical protein AAGH65_11525, partial [Pseudomonadota bacterium]